MLQIPAAREAIEAAINVTQQQAIAGAAAKEAVDEATDAPDSTSEVNAATDEPGR